MRGKLHSPYISPPRVRITPAGAGKTHSSPHVPFMTRDHPRGCGENFRKPPYRVKNVGSPPRMRGKPRSICGNRHTNRITPADAGKTYKNSETKAPAMDHPRGCGENHIQRKLSVCKQGSPPRMRGKHGSNRNCRCLVGITPADAGKTNQL